MSNRSDLLKALARAGYKNASSSGKHLIFSNGQQIISMPKGNKMGSGMVHNILSTIRKGTNSKKEQHNTLVENK